MTLPKWVEDWHDTNNRAETSTALENKLYEALAIAVEALEDLKIRGANQPASTFKSIAKKSLSKSLLWGMGNESK